MRVPSGLHIDNPAYPLLQEFVSYWGVTSAAGAADGTTLISANLANEPSYQGHLVKVLSGDAAGQVRRIVNDTTNATGTVVFDSPATDSAGNAEQITASTLFVIISDFEGDALYYGTATSAGAGDGSTIIDTGLATPFTVDDEPIGHSIRILTSSDATLVGQEREVYDYDVGTTTLVLNPRFISQVPVDTTYVVLRNRPSGGGGPIPPPEPAAEETLWRLADYDNFDVADATADTERWSSEYQVGAADGSADINTTTAGALRVNITAAAVLAAAQYGVRRLWRNVVRKFFTLTDVTVTVTSPNANHVWAGLAVSRGIAWDANNYIAIYKRQDNVPVEGIAVEYNLAGAGVVTTTILATTDDAIAFKIERENTIWRCYYSLSQAPHHNWILALEIEDPTNSLTDTTSTYLTVYNPEDAVGQRIAADFHRWEYYETLGNFGDIINMLLSSSGALAFIGYCPPGMAASTTAIVCPNLGVFPNDIFNSGYQMIVLKNNSALGTAPEMEMRDITDFITGSGTFTVEAFSANVEAGDIVLIIHNSVAKNISVFGIADAGSDASTIRDAARTEGNDYWNGQQVMMLSGNARGQVRPIYDFVAATDDILVTPAFGAAIAAGDIYCVLTQYQELVPGADATLNLLPSDVVGNKTDVPDYTRSATQSSIVALIKGILGSRVVAEGTLTLSSATVPEDNANAAIADSYNGLLLMPLTGADAFLPRRILDWTAGTGIAGTGVFTIDPNNPFPAATGTVLYVVIADQTEFVPGANGANNRTPSDVVGDKTSTAIYAKDAVSDIIRYLKGLMDSTITAWGTADAGSGVGAVVDAARTEANDWWNGQTILMLTGAAAFQKRPILDFVAATDTITPTPDFDAAVGAGDIYVILAHYNMIVPRSPDNTDNELTSDVVGRQDDTIPAMNVAPPDATIVRIIKAILERVGQTPADGDDSLLTTVGQRDDAVTVAATATIISLLRNIHAALSIVAAGAGGGFEIDGAPGLVTALGTTGAVVADNAASVLGAVGADNANNAFASTNVVANIDGSVLERLEAISSGVIVGTGTFTTDSATVPADLAGQGAKATNYFKGCLLIPLTGVCALQPRLIVGFTTGTGVFTLDAEEPFTAAPGLVTYVIVATEADLVPAANNLNLTTTAQVIGNKGDAATADDMSALATATLVAEVKRILLRISSVALSVTIDPGGSARTELRTLWDDLGAMLAGAGITTWPAAAAPADGVSFAEAIRQIYNDIVAINSGFQEQADTTVNITAIAAGETDVLNLAVAATRYIVRSLRLKFADPGANTITVRLYELVNDVSTVVDTFVVDTTIFATYHSLMDMFGLSHLAGDNLRVTVQASAGGPYAVTGQYSHATAT